MGLGDAFRGFESEGLAFFLNVAEVVMNVVGFDLEHLLKREEAAFAMDALAEPSGLGEGVEDLGHLNAQGLEEGKLGVQVAILVKEAGGELGFVVADQERSFFGDHALHAVGPGLLGVSEVGDDFEGAPATGDGSIEDLGASHAVDRGAQRGASREVGVDGFGAVVGARHGLAPFVPRKWLSSLLNG